MSSSKQGVNANEVDKLPISQQSLNETISSNKNNQRPRRRQDSSVGIKTLYSVDFLRRAKSEFVPPDAKDAATRHRSFSKENHALFKDLAHLADKNEPVHFDTFRQSSVRRHSRASKAFYSDTNEETDVKSDVNDSFACNKLNIELLEAYLVYCKSIGHEPNFTVSDEVDLNDQNSVRPDAKKLSDRSCVLEHQHFWTTFFGTRYSKQRGCVQFWAWLGIGVGVVIWLGFSLSGLHLNEVLHLDAFTAQNVQVTQDYTFLHFRDKVAFYLTYTIETRPDTLSAGAMSNSSYFNALLLTKKEYNHYVKGEPFEYVREGSALRTTSAYMPRTYIENSMRESTYFIIQPCHLSRDPSKDYCQTLQLPSSVNSKEKIYHLNNMHRMSKHVAWEHFSVNYISVDPEPVPCSSSGIVGSAYLLLFIPYVVITFFGLRVFQMISRCESFQDNIERMYARELEVPENEVDYWQPMPWDRKVPKTRLCGPWCWTRFRRPFEPFYTWWRHENYFTWIVCPYRNEQLSRGERTLIVVCSLYITFYVLFICVMLRDSWGRDMTIFTSVVLYAILVAVMTSAGKATFKELFKLIFRQRRKYFRAKATGGNLKGVSFRLAFLLQVLVALLLTLAQGPIFYIWAYRSCLFLTQFVYYGVLAAIARMSLMGLVQDFVWYSIIKTWGWKDLCPYCTERIQHCDCFNDELLVLALQHVGPKWELIRDLDGLLARQKQYEPQFALYTPEQLRERWSVIVQRAEKHMEKVEKLRVYRAKKQQDAVQDGRIRQSLTTFLSDDKKVENKQECGNSTTDFEEQARDLKDDLCCFREKKILALNSKIELDEFERHYDSNIADVFYALAHSIMRSRRHEKREPVEESDKEENENKLNLRTSITTRQSSESSSIGESMWVFDTPAQRLERREEENLQRNRAFRVLEDYKIEEVGAHMAITPSISNQDTRQVPLISTQSQAITQQQDYSVILMPDVHEQIDENCSNNVYVVTNAKVDDNYSDRYESDRYPSDLERGQFFSILSFQSEGGSRKYKVIKRRKTLLQRLSTSAEAFAAWALDYDPKAAQHL